MPGGSKGGAAWCAGEWALRFHEELAGLLASGERVAVATVVGARGSHPREVGSKMIVRQDGRTSFSIGGGALEASVTADCRAALAGAGEGGAIHAYDLSEHGRRSVGMTCGGSVEVLVEILEPPGRLVVFGAGHVGSALAAVAAPCGLVATMVDDRAERLEPGAFPRGTVLHRCGRDYASDLPAVEPGDSVAVLTRCHETDVAVLRALAPARLRYLGMIGSRRKVARALEVLEREGIARDWLDGIHGPIGLSIGAQTPGEIAVAIAAEIVSVLRATPSGRTA